MAGGPAFLVPCHLCCVAPDQTAECSATDAHVGASVLGLLEPQGLPCVIGCCLSSWLILLTDIGPRSHIESTLGRAGHLDEVALASRSLSGCVPLQLVLDCLLVHQGLAKWRQGARQGQLTAVTYPARVPASFPHRDASTISEDQPDNTSNPERSCQ